jgi:hypothetical protein
MGKLAGGFRLSWRQQARVRIAGLMMIHSWSPLGSEELVISELARHVEGVFVLANTAGAGVPESWVKAAKACPKLAKYEEGVETDWQGPWGMRLLDDAKPQFVLYPDSDEIMPPNIEECIDNMLAHHLRCVEFPVVWCAGDVNHIIPLSMTAPAHAPHVKLAVWRPGLEKQHGDFNYPAPDYAGMAWPSPWALRHLAVMKPRDWRRRFVTKHDPWLTQPWAIEKYDPAKCWR